MRKAYLAELVLSLVTSQERALSIVGDLLEENEGRGTWQFWLRVVQTGLSQVWQQMAATPFVMAGAAIRSMFVGLRFTLLATCGIVVVMILIVVPLVVLGFHLDPPDVVSTWLSGLACYILVPFQVGRWISGRYPGREAAVSLTSATLQVVMSIGLDLILWRIRRNHGEALVDFGTLASTIFSVLSYQMVVLAGAAFARAKSLKSAVV